MNPSLASNGLVLSSAEVLPATTPRVDIRGLTLAYGRQHVLQGLNWQLQAGQVVGLLGRNGAGKTTLLEALLGLRDVQAGRCGSSVSPPGGWTMRCAARIGYVPQASDLFADLRADELLSYFRSFYPRWNAAKVQGLLSNAGRCRATSRSAA
jgi:ABC-2 type transport system ATP-binding protein